MRRTANVDFNPTLPPEFGRPRASPAEKAILHTLEAAVDGDLITMSTDGNASVPITLEDGSPGPYEKSLSWLWDAVVELAQGGGLPLSRALSFVTTNPARALRLETRKGRRPARDRRGHGDRARLRPRQADGRRRPADDDVAVRARSSVSAARPSRPVFFHAMC